MKKLLLSALFCGASLLSFAQPTFDFETWTGSGANEDPFGWFTGNILVNGLFPGNVQSVFKVTGAEAHGGTYAMKIVSVDVNTNPAPTQVPDPIGIAAPGAVSFIPSTSLKVGFKYTAKPTSAEFWYKYAPTSGGDTATFFLLLWNGVSKDTIATALWKTGATVGAYTQQSVPLVYDPNMSAITPDSMAIIFSSTKLLNPDYTFCLNCGKVGSILHVDDVTFTAPTGINDKNISKEGVILYPNPAADVAYISVDTEDAYAVNLFDITGKQIQSAVMQESQNSLNKKSASINTAGLSNGLYSYSITDKNGNTLRAGKLNVAK